MTTGEKAGLAGGVSAVVGAVLPWATFGRRTINGLDGDGLITLVFGIAVGALIVVRDWERMDQIGAAVLGLLTLGLAGNVYSNLGSASRYGYGMYEVSTSPGIGLYLTLLAGILMLAGAWLGYNDEQVPRQPTRNYGE